MVLGQGLTPRRMASRNLQRARYEEARRLLTVLANAGAQLMREEIDGERRFTITITCPYNGEYTKLALGVNDTLPAFVQDNH